MTKTEDVPIGKLHIDPMNIRPEPDVTLELVDSVRDEGVLEPLVVRPHDGEYGVILGSRRLVAAKNAGLDEVPCVIREDLEGDDAKAEDLSFKENEHRADLPPKRVGELVVSRYEETDGRRSKESRVGEVADRLNLGNTTVRRYVDVFEKIDAEVFSSENEGEEDSETEKEGEEPSESEKFSSRRNASEGSDFEKEGPDPLSVLEDVPVEVAEEAANSDFFLKQQEENPEKARELMKEAAEKGRNKVGEVLRKFRKEFEESKRRTTAPSAPKPERLTVLVGVRTAKALDEWAEEKEGIDTRSQAVKRVLRRFFNKRGYYE